MKKITLAAALFMTAITYSQTPTSHLINGNFDTGTSAYVNNTTADNWKARVIAKSGNSDPVIATYATQSAVSVSGNALHLNITTANGVGKPNIRLEMTPTAVVIDPAPTTVVASGSIVYTIKFKIRFSGAITNNLQIQSVFTDGSNVTVAPTGTFSVAGGVFKLTTGGNIAVGKADIDASGLALDAWHDVQVDYQFADATTLIKQKTFQFSMGKIPEGVDFYVDEITQEFKAGDTTLSINNLPLISSNFSIYPNPTKDVLNYDLKNAKKFEIYNLLGQKKLNGKATGSINVSELAKGLYILKIIAVDNSATTKKFTIK